MYEKYIEKAVLRVATRSSNATTSYQCANIALLRSYNLARFSSFYTLNA